MHYRSSPLVEIIFGSVGVDDDLVSLTSVVPPVIPAHLVPEFLSMNVMCSNDSV